MRTNTTPAPADFPRVDKVIEAMRAEGCWVLRKRRGVRPALWRTAEHGTCAPALPQDVEQWMLATFPQWASTEKTYVLKVAEATLAELRYHDHGLPTLTDADVRLIT